MTGIYEHAMTLLDARAWRDDWLLTIRACVRRGGGNFCSLWESLGPEIGLDELETLNRGTALYLWFCTLNLVDDIMDGDCDYVSPRDRPLAVLGMCTQVQRAMAWTKVSANGRIHTLDLMGECIHGQKRETKGCNSPTEYIEIGDAIAGDQFAAYFGLFAEGTIFKSASGYGRMYGRAAHVLKDFKDKDSRLLECGDVPAVVAWALNGLDEATALVPPPSVASRIETVRSALQAMDAAAPSA